MNFDDIRLIDDSKFDSVLKPQKRKKGIVKNPLIIGFDTKHSVIDGKQNVTLQFSREGISKFYVLDGTSETKVSIYSFPIYCLTDHLFRFISELGIEDIGKTIYLISHNAHDEISNFDLPSEFKAIPINDGLFIEGEVSHPRIDKKIRLLCIDLYSLLNSKLKNIADDFNIPSTTLDEIGGKSESYWKENIHELLHAYPEMYEKLLTRDAEITYSIYKQLRSFFSDEYNLDLLHFKTLAQLAGDILKRDYLKKPLTRIKTRERMRGQTKRLAGGEKKVYRVKEKIETFDGDMNVRKIAMFAYHGGRIEAYVRGRFENVNLVYLDVESLHPASAIDQPLPVASTKWHRYTKRNEDRFLSKAEGFVEVEFKFDDSNLYPCLPVDGLRDEILYFPQEGISFCTLAELRIAIKLGLKEFNILSGYGFYPGKKELENPVKDFFIDMFRKKKESEKGTLGYKMHKDMMNSVVGKFAQRDKNTETLDMVRHGLITSEAHQSLSKRKLHRVGSLWWIEGASLILGRARSIMAEFVNMGAYFISTDSVLLPADVDISCESLDELRSVGSDLKKEFDVDHGIIIRTRLYALNPNSDNLRTSHFARHAVSCTPDWYIETMRDGFNSREIPDLNYTSKRTIKFQKSIEENKPLNTLSVKESRMEIDWDGKRRLHKEVENPFTDFSWSRPLTAEEVDNNDMRKEPKEKPGRKAGKKLDTAKKREITRQYQEGKRQKDIAEELGVSPSWVSKVCKEFKGEGNPCLII